jgi:hypothetical protein
VTHITPDAALLLALMAGSVELALESLARLDPGKKVSSLPPGVWDKLVAAIPLLEQDLEDTLHPMVIAQQLVEGEVPYSLQLLQQYSVDLFAISAGLEAVAEEVLRDPEQAKAAAGAGAGAAAPPPPAGGMAASAADTARMAAAKAQFRSGTGSGPFKVKTHQLMPAVTGSSLKSFGALFLLEVRP